MLQYLISCCFFIVFSTVHVLSLSFKNDNFFIINYFFVFVVGLLFKKMVGTLFLW